MLWHPAHMISSTRRLSVLPHLAFAFVALIGPYVDPADGRSPLLTAVAALLPLQWWLLGFTVPLMASILTITTRAYVAWIIANISMLFLGSAWFVALILVRISDDVYTSTTGFGLWIFVVVACLVNVRVPVAVTTSDGET